MKRLAVAGVIWVMLAGLFIFGIFSGAVVPLMAAFCLWTPGTLFVGYSLGKVGLKISIAAHEMSPPVPAARPKEVQRVNRVRNLQEDMG